MHLPVICLRTKIMKHWGIICLILHSFYCWGQHDKTSLSTSDSLIIQLDDPVARMLDSSFLLYYFQCDDFTTDTSLLNDFNYSPNEIPLTSDSAIIDRLDKMSERSPIAFSPHRNTIAYAKLYSQKKRRLTSRMLGLGELYFPLFEELLAKYQLPEELKYLPVVESALNAKAISPMGAAGLWQFMPRTAESKGLEVSYYIDERSDLFKATDAACRYLKDAYEIYEDWHLAIASYNSGPGNVNKAIRRSNGKTNFWEIIKFLPKETQNYVPAFLGCAYAMTYYREHNIYPVQSRRRFHELDTVWIDQRIKFSVLEEYINVSIEELEFLNPSYPKALIPDTEEDRVLLLPVMAIGIFEGNKDSIYAKSKRRSSLPGKSDSPSVLTYHIVKSGENLGLIANEHGCSVGDLKRWNYLKTDLLRTGKKLRIYAPKQKEKKGTKLSVTTIPKEKERREEGVFYYTIKKGDTLWHVAQRYEGVTMDDLKSENSHLNFKNLKTGTKIKIPK